MMCVDSADHSDLIDCQRTSQDYLSFYSFFLLLCKVLNKGHSVLSRQCWMGSLESVTDQPSALTAMDHLGALQEEQAAG